MTIVYEKGYITFKINQKKVLGGLWRIQIFYPYFHFKRGKGKFFDFYITGNSVIRIYRGNHTLGFGFEILGLGLASDWNTNKE